MLARARDLSGLLRIFTASLQFRILFRAMELRPVPPGDNAAGVFEHSGALCPIRLTRAELTARALHGTTVPDPADGVV